MSAKPGVFTPIHRIHSEGAGDSVRTLPVAADQNIKTFDVLILSTGLLAQAIALPGSNNSGSAPGSLTIYAIALAPITTGASPSLETDRIPVRILDAAGRNRLVTRLYNATAADSQQQDALVGTSYRLGRWRGASADQWWYYLSTTTAQGDTVLHKMSPDSKPTDNYGIVEIGK